MEHRILLDSSAVPASWHDVKHRCGARSGKRSTLRHPLWNRIDACGHTIWLSEPRLLDGASASPTRSGLSPEARQRFDEVLEAVTTVLSSAGSVRVD